jgi:haloalkane dehalogenase
VSDDAPFRPDPRLFPFESRWLDSAVGRVHYIDEGEGDPILFLHGNPTWSFLYRGVVIRLRKRFRCVALDYPGFGLSERPATYGYTPADHAGVVRELVGRLDLRNLTIMGHDWGGSIGMSVAADELDRVRALVMGNTWYWPIDSWQLKAMAYLFSMAPVQTMMLDRNVFVEKVLPWGVKHPLADEVLRHYREVMPSPASRVGATELAAQLIDASTWLSDLQTRVRERLANVPLLLTWGVSDVAFPRRYVQRFRDDFRRVTVARLDAKHFIQEDAPAEIARAIEDFLASVDVASGAA